MKLYRVQRNSRIRVREPDWDGPRELDFMWVDGMYSLCYDDDGQVVHLKAWTEVDRLGPRRSYRV